MPRLNRSGGLSDWGAIVELNQQRAALVKQNEFLVAAVSNFLGWIDSPDLEWGGVPETPELVALRAALEQVK